MSRKNSQKKNNGNNKKSSGRGFRFSLPGRTKRYISGVLMILLAIIVVLSFFDLSGEAGQWLKKAFLFLIGNVFFLVPLFSVFGGLAFLKSEKKNLYYPTFLAISILILGITGILAALDSKTTPSSSFSNGLKVSHSGGVIGFLINWPVYKAFNFWVTEIIFLALVVIGSTIFWQIFYRKPETKIEKEEPSAQTPLIKQIFGPKFKIKQINPVQGEQKQTPVPSEIKPAKEIAEKNLTFKYEKPPLDLLESDKGTPTTGDIIQNSEIIKKTLQNFDIPVEMAEVNIGPTVTQYTLKPAEGIKLSKITTLANDLSLSLAAHPIRIEAPIPGRSLVGIEIPNKTRTQVRLRNLLEKLEYQNSGSTLVFPLGRDVAGNPNYADLARMPHLLVAGATGTGKTIGLNSIIISLLYKNSPEMMRLILVDPKRVEFSLYAGLPHLLCPVIYDPQRTVNVLKWLIKEMERRFDVLSEAKYRDIGNYNTQAAKKGESPLPYIIVIIDELADLMAARGKDIEAGIVRLAQMARAVGIHLIVATQRPSVEVITGLIKANITSRITFQVASQVDSRTVIDAAGAERLLGAGDMLFISADFAKPKRIQGAYISEKESKRVTEYIKSHVQISDTENEPEIETRNNLAEDLKIDLESPLTESSDVSFGVGGDDVLYEEAKKVVIEAKKASASLLQRRLRVGYARAARLLDILEEKGVVGPSDGAKPREVYFKNDAENLDEEVPENDDWQKV